MGEGGPKLSVVAPPGASPQAGAPGSQSAGRDDSAGSPKLIWLLAALLLILGVAVVTQLQRARELESRITALTGELATAQAAVDAYRTQMGAVQGRLGVVRASARDLERSLAELEDLAARDPVAASLNE